MSTEVVPSPAAIEAPRKVPRVSVIIPTDRRPHLLGAAIQSVLDQSFQDFEIVVVDDNSGEGTSRSFEDSGTPGFGISRTRRIGALERPEIRES